MEQQEITKINLTETELIELVNEKRELLVEFCNKALEHEKKGKTEIIFEDELGVENKGVIIRRDNNTIFWFWSNEDYRKEKREVNVWFRQPIKKTILDDSANIKEFEVKYKDREGCVIGYCNVKYCCDGKTVSYADYSYYDETKNETKLAHLDKSYERILIQGILQNRLKEHANDKCNDMSVNK